MIESVQDQGKMQPKKLANFQDFEKQVNGYMIEFVQDQGKIQPRKLANFQDLEKQLNVVSRSMYMIESVQGQGKIQLKKEANFQDLEKQVNAIYSNDDALVFHKRGMEMMAMIECKLYPSTYHSTHHFCFYISYLQIVITRRDMEGLGFRVSYVTYDC